MIRQNEIRSFCHSSPNVIMHEPLWGLLQVTTCIWMYSLVTDYWLLHMNNGFNIVGCQILYALLYLWIYMTLCDRYSHIFLYSIFNFRLMKTLAPPNACHCLNSTQPWAMNWMWYFHLVFLSFIHIWFCRCLYLSIILFALCSPFSSSLVYMRWYFH